MGRISGFRRGLWVTSLGVLTITGAGVASAASTAQGSTADTFENVAEAYAAIGDGDRDRDSVSPTWADVSPATRNARETALRAVVARMEKLPAPVDEQARFNRSFLEHIARTDLQGFAFDETRMPFSNGQGFFRQLGAAANTTVIRDKADAENWLVRLAGVPQFYDAQIANMRRGLKDGFTQSTIIVDEVLKPLRAAAAVPVKDDVLLKPLVRLPASIPAAEQDALRMRAQKIVETKVRPAQRAAITFMEGEYRPAARTTLAARDLPNGDAYYRFLVRKFTTTDLTPEQVHDLGKQEVARLEAEMTALIRETGFSGSLAAFNDALRNDPANYAASPEDYMEKASEVAKRADRAAPRWFGKLPRLTWGPVFKSPEQEGTANIYMRGSPAKGVPGSIMMSFRDATTSPLYQLPAWVIHEGVPGHHFQIALSQELDSLPVFRREARVTAFIEGWALYSEGLAEEMGLYRDAKERFGRLSFEMYRACRLVMDTGIHWMRWTRDEAKTCLARNTALSPAMVEFETNRYISQPGQALAYKVGQLRISAIRARAEQALGPKFDIRTFHDALLAEGAMPLDLLDTYMNAWIARNR